MKCWAKSLGKCSSIQSGEHYISKTLWKTGKVIVEGFSWLKGEKKELPIAALTANILCKAHNEQLSPVDAHSDVVWGKMDRLNALENFRRGYPNTKYWTPVTEVVDGRLFERWLTKTAINLFCVTAKHELWAETKMKPMIPPPSIIRACYALGDLEKPQGMYVFADVGDKIAFQDAVGFEAIFDKEKCFVGAFIKFKGFKFLIWFSHEHPFFLTQIPHRVPRIQFMHVYKSKYRHSHSLKFKLDM
jgi:hypothetical protein